MPTSETPALLLFAHLTEIVESAVCRKPVGTKNEMKALEILLFQVLVTQACATTAGLWVVLRVATCFERLLLMGADLLTHIPSLGLHNFHFS